jgi:hypothetical protein
MASYSPFAFSSRFAIGYSASRRPVAAKQRGKAADGTRQSRADIECGFASPSW